jgi:predicted amidohydrolase YtcJ
VRSKASLLIVNAAPWSGTRIVDADALALGDGRVLAYGREAELAELRGPDTEILDARGATVTPGITDAHIHLLSWARAAMESNLIGATSRAEAVARVATFATAHPERRVVIGRGWDSAAWSEPPHHDALDAVVADRPVLLHSRDFHNLWVNRAALAAAGIDRRTPDPPGGKIERDVQGEPTGVLREHAVRLCAELERSTPADDARALDAAVRRLHAHGVTAIHDFGGAESHGLLRAHVERGESPLRVLMHLNMALEEALAMGAASGDGDDGFRIGALKLFADGTLGSRTAALLEPYDGTDERGMDVIPPRDLARIVRRAFEAGLSVAVHAIGDRAVRSALDAFEASQDAIPGLDLAPRIEHVQLLDPADAPRFAALGVAASMQPVHCTSDMDQAARDWASRHEWTYPWRALLDLGATLAFGSDAPVEEPSVAAGLHAAVTRERADRRGAYVPGQRIGLDEALRAYTEAPARLAASESRLGRLAPGAPGDVVVWDRDLHATDPSSLFRARPVMTVFGGRIVHRREARDELRVATAAGEGA